MPSESRTSFEWHQSGAHLVQRSLVDIAEAPDSISIIGCDAANGTYYQLYSDDRVLFDFRRWRSTAVAAAGRTLNAVRA